MRRGSFVAVSLIVAVLALACGGAAATPEAATPADDSSAERGEPAESDSAPGASAAAAATTAPAKDDPSLETPSPITAGMPVSEDLAAGAEGVMTPAETGPSSSAAMTERAPIVVLDPGHGGEEVGAASNGIVESASNLEMALRVEALLTEQGIEVVLTRRNQGRLDAPPSDIDPDSALPGFLVGRADRQARVDLANMTGADLFIGIHSNGSANVEQRGVEVWYDPNRSFGEENLTLAEAVLTGVIRELRAYGYAARDRGVRDDTCWRFSERAGRCFPLFVLGPTREIQRDDVIRFGIEPEQIGFAPGQDVLRTRATQMPAALVELLFVTNGDDARVLRSDAGRAAIARGIAGSVVEYFALQNGEE